MHQFVMLHQTLPGIIVCYPFHLQECTIFVSGDGITEEILRKEFSKFGPIQTVTVDTAKGWAEVFIKHFACYFGGLLQVVYIYYFSFILRTGFITYDSPRVSNTAKKEVRYILIYTLSLHLPHMIDG